MAEELLDKIQRLIVAHVMDGIHPHGEPSTKQEDDNLADWAKRLAQRIIDEAL